MPENKTLAAFGPYVLLVLFAVVVFAPNLFGGQVFFGEEQIGFYYAISDYVKQSTASGETMVWISNYYGGVPASLDQFVSAWYPVNRLLFTLFDTFTAHHLSMLFGVVVGLVATYLFGRTQGWLRTSSLSLALMYFLATTYNWLVIGTTAAHAFAVLPLLLLALHLSSRGHYILGILLGSVALGVGFLAGFVQIVFYECAIAGAYALFLDWSAYSRGTPLVRAPKTLYAYAAMTLGGLAVGFLQFFPSASLIDLTIRTSSYAAQHATYPYPTEFITWFLPPYLEVPFLGGGSAAGFYIGVLGLVCAILGLIYYRTRASIFFAGLYALILAFAFHVSPFGWINEHLPPFSHMGGNFRWSVAAAFPLAYLGAAGMDGFLRNPERLPRRAARWIIIGMGSVSLLLILASLALQALARAVVASPTYLNALLDWYTAGRTLSFAREHYLLILTNSIADVARHFSLGEPRFFLGTLLWVVGTAVFAAAYYKPRLPRSALFLAFTLATAIGSTMLLWSDLVPRSLYAEPPLSQTIKAQGDPRHDYRVMGYLVGDGTFLALASRDLTVEEMTSLQMQTLANNTSIYFGFDRMDGMEPYRTLRHNHLLDTVIAYSSASYAFDDESPVLATSPLDQLYNRDVQKKVTVEEKLRDLPKRLPLLSMMNVKYLLSPFELHAPSLTEIADIPVTLGEDSPLTLHLYENTRVLPRIYAVRGPVYVASERDALLATVRETDFAKRTIIECTTCTDTAHGKAAIDIEEYANGRISFRANAAADSWVVISESAFPGWKATIDGAPTPIYTANYLFQAVRVPAGEHTVTLTYHDIALDMLRSAF